MNGEQTAKELEETVDRLAPGEGSVATEEAPETPEEPKRPVGRPLLFGSVEELDSAIEEWSKARIKKQLPRTITSLAVALNTSRETISQYAERAEFIDSIKKAKDWCEQDAEDHLYSGRQAAGVIFSLKNNYGWKDKTEVDQNLSGEVGTYTIEVTNFKGASGNGEPQE